MKMLNDVGVSSIRGIELEAIDSRQWLPAIQHKLSTLLQWTE
jgi:hypothetical protein